MNERARSQYSGSYFEGLPAGISMQLHMARTAHEYHVTGAPVVVVMHFDRLRPARAWLWNDPPSPLVDASLGPGGILEPLVPRERPPLPPSPHVAAMTGPAVSLTEPVVFAFAPRANCHLSISTLTHSHTHTISSTPTIILFKCECVLVMTGSFTEAHTCYTIVPKGLYIECEWKCEE